jgi:hypothetical protein
LLLGAYTRGTVRKAADFTFGLSPRFCGLFSLSGAILSASRPGLFFLDLRFAFFAALKSEPYKAAESAVGLRQCMTGIENPTRLGGVRHSAGADNQSRDIDRQLPTHCGRRDPGKEPLECLQEY